MIEIDGSFGEGGGQVLRTSLALAALTGQATHIHSIRAGRRNPGLAPQHLTGVLALASVCGAVVEGAKIGSTEAIFRPTSPPVAGTYDFDVTDAAQGGSAGSVTLIFQTLLLPLWAAAGESRVTLRGGTHVAWSPPYHYLERVFLPTVARMGIHAEIALEGWGFYPVGGGAVRALVGHQSPVIGRQSSDDHSPFAIRTLRLVERGALKRVSGIAAATKLPANIPQRIANRATNYLQDNGVKADVQPLRERGAGPGVGLFLTAEFENGVAGFSSLGEKGKPSERVAEEACLDFLAFRGHADAAVDMRLADQLLLPLALADGVSECTTCRVTQHLLTNAHIIRQFIDARIEIAGEEGAPGHVTVHGVSFTAESAMDAESRQ
ncbi:MAG: RNA 3'-phosphate cyclase [Chloroflexi bacterium]|nr:RNA 3'-phosphate cyclase [Chloroflexota bacterium]